MSEVSPREILKQVAAAVPTECHRNIIIVGSLAAGYFFFGNDGSMQVRTKDIDCVLSPRIAAVEKGTVVAQKLLAGGWSPRTEGDHGKPGDASTPDDKLPAVRLFPPGSGDWFIELLTVPESEDDLGRRWTRLKLSAGHYGLPSFEFLSLSTYRPIKTEFGVFCARPRMMALANLLEHPEIKADTMAGLIEGRKIKRSNKDVGRALAIARLSDDVEQWPDKWKQALESCFPSRWIALAASVGAGIRALLASEQDLEEALFTCNNGLLSSCQVTLDQLRISAERLLQDAINPLEEAARNGYRLRKS